VGTLTAGLRQSETPSTCELLGVLTTDMGFRCTKEKDTRGTRSAKRTPHELQRR
jgi:hypothetical protein